MGRGPSPKRTSADIGRAEAPVTGANVSGRRRCHGEAMPVSFAAVPVYDYRCEQCSTQFEVRQSFSDDTLTVCPPEGGPASCVSPGEGTVKKVFSGVAIAFKGDGFYKNDHGSIAKGRRKEKESSSASSNGSSPASKDSSSPSSSSDSASSSDSSRSKADAGASSSSSSTS